MAARFRAAVGAVLAGAVLAGCAIGNQAGQLQVPAIITGLVTASPTCASGSAGCPSVVTTIAGAIVQAVGKDGTHEAVTDANGHYQIALLVGEWTLAAQRTGTSSSTGPSKRLDVGAGQNLVVNLEAGP